MFHIVCRSFKVSMQVGPTPTFWDSHSVTLYSTKDKAEALVVLDDLQADLEPRNISLDEMTEKFLAMAAQTDAEILNETDFVYYTFRLPTGWKEVFCLSAREVWRGVQFDRVTLCGQHAAL